MCRLSLMIKAILYVFYKFFYNFGFYELFKGTNIIFDDFPVTFSVKHPFIIKEIKDSFTAEELRRKVLLEEINKTLEEAKNVCDHKFKIFDKIFRFDEEINWHISENNNVWPIKKWYRIELDNTKFGDVKYTWELNRHQHLTTLGRAYFYTKDEKFAIEFKNEVVEWIKNNPVEYGINWSSGLEIAIRAISWIVSMDFFYDSAVIEEAFLNDFLKTLWYSGKHIYQNLFYTEHLMNNNHLIGEATGLLFISLYFNRESVSEKWFKKAIEILKREAKNQFRSDGTSMEESSSYEVFSLYFLLLNILLLKNKGVSIPLEISTAVERCINFIQYLIKPAGDLAKYGDCDEAKVLVLSNNNQVEDILSLASVVFERGDFKYSINKEIFPENVFFLLGKNGLDKWNNLKVEKHDKIKYFSKGRIGVVNDDDFLFVKFNDISGHSHADIGHFLLSAFREDLIVDSGTYKYNVYPELRRYFRSSEAHNTLIIDGINQAIPIRRFNWIAIYKVLNTSFSIIDGIAKFQVTCKIPLNRYKFFHTRAFLYSFQHLLIIIDEINGEGKHNVELNFHLSPIVEDVKVLGNFARFPFISKEKSVLLISGSSENIANPIINFKKGWFSPSYGIKTEAPMINFKYTDLELPEKLITVICWGKNVSKSGNILNSIDFGKLSDLDDIEIAKGILESFQGGL